MPLVLCIGIDEVLLKTRKLLLESEGHTVVSARSEAEIVAACEVNDFDVAVISQTVSAPKKRRFLEIIRKQCRGAKVLELYPVHGHYALRDADDWLIVPTDVPPQLSARVSALAQRRSGSSRKPRTRSK